MDNPNTLRSKAARLFENAASSNNTREAEKLTELGRQLELWADDLDEMTTQLGASTRAREETGANRSED